ncbi:MAG: hypothetical protein WDA16_01995 [Candidatus Thermoplasmatota archaeon]
MTRVMRNASLFALGMTCAIGMLGTALADPTAENVTKLKNGIVETLATWIPFVILFILLGLALAAIGIDWTGMMRRHGPR